MIRLLMAVIPSLLVLLLWSCQPKANEPFHSFWQEFQSALESNNPDQLARYIYFPLRGAPLLLGQNKTTMSREEFKTGFPQLFDRPTREKLLDLASGELDTYVVEEGSFPRMMDIPVGYTVYVARLEYPTGTTRNYHFAPHDDSFKLHYLDPKK